MEKYFCHRVIFFLFFYIYTRGLTLAFVTRENNNNNNDNLQTPLL